eukprot:SAG31_NODE_3485_length_4211_cov_2.074903_1_plen_245_part_00
MDPMGGSSAVQSTRVEAQDDAATAAAAAATAVAFLRQHQLSAEVCEDIMRASGAQCLGDLHALDKEGAAATVAAAQLTPVAASRFRRAVSTAAVASTPPSPPSPQPPPTAAQLNALLAKGGLVQLPPGVIEVDRPLLLGVSGTVLEGAGPGVTILRLKKSGQAIQMLSLLYGTVTPDGSCERTTGLVVRNLTVDGGQSMQGASNPVVPIGAGPSALDMNAAMGIYASDVLVQSVTFQNYYVTAL